MFTGIIQTIKPIVDILEKEKRKTLIIQLDEFTENLAHGASVAINGICLTVVEIKNGCAYFDVIPETLEKTTLGQLKKYDKVNIERALKVGDELGGHWVLGHVDGVAKILQIEHEQSHYKVWFSLLNAALAVYLISKGSITLDGVSLTLVDVDKEKFSVCLIPETLKLTTLGEKHVGDHINVECDYLAKLIVDKVKQFGSS